MWVDTGSILKIIIITCIVKWRYDEAELNQ